MFDYHVHSSFSADGKMSMAEACARAVDLGILEIAFTDHVDYVYPGSPLNWEFEHDVYEREVVRCEGLFGRRLTVIRGAELGLHPNSHARNETFTSAYPFDFLIGSVHIVGIQDLDNGEYFEGRSLEDAGRVYLETVNQCVRDYHGFNVLGHLDLFKRYLHFIKRSRQDVTWTDYHDIIEDTFRVLIQTGRGIEVNMSGFRSGAEYTLPEPEMVKLYRRIGGEVITVGSDAHRVEQVGLQLRRGYEILEQAGFKYVTTFRRREPVFRPVRSLL
ncbi:MAG: histidinol-phosphatase HisJ family protein [Clostridia bacterium]|nr:histidinol-phosphatase HisJ family protein [Clostridia bacterium]